MLCICIFVCTQPSSMDFVRFSNCVCMVLRAANAAVEKDPDILPQACCALSTLTAVEGLETAEDEMRNMINQDVTCFGGAV